MPTLIDLISQGRQVPHHYAWPRAIGNTAIWNSAVSQLAEGHWGLLDLWAEPDMIK